MHSAPDRRHAEHRHHLPDALAACAAAIGSHLRHEVPEQEMHHAVERFAHHMNQCGVPPERALAQLKTAILQVPEVAARRAVERGELLRVLVQAAIRSYYDEDDSPM